MMVDELTDGIYFERLNRRNLTDLVKLYHIVYGKKVPFKYFLKKYDTAFAQVEYIGYLAYNEQKRPVGYYGVIPCFLKLNNELVLAAQSADTMTHPAYRFKGLFTKLAGATYQLCIENNIGLLFGFPNQNSLPGFINKLGWRVTEQMDCFIIETGNPRLIELLYKFSPLRALLHSYQDKKLKKLLFHQLATTNTAFTNKYDGILYNKHYSAYKSYGNNKVIKLGNAIIWLKINRELLIGDMWVSPADFNETVRLLKKLARQLGASDIHFHTSKGTKLHALFSKQVDAISSFAVIFKDLGSSLCVENIRFTAAAIDTF